MSFAVLGTRLKNLVIIDKDCTDKTYPEFWDDFSSLQYQVQGFVVLCVSGVSLLNFS